MAPATASHCSTRVYSTTCLPEIAPRSYKDPASSRPPASSDMAAFGFNWTHPTAPLAHPWRYFSTSELGANTAGQQSAAVPSFRTFESGGFVAIVMPFFSATLLPEQRGSASEVIDFRKHAIRRSADPTARPAAPRYYCVRLSWNGEHLHQVCDPNDPLTNRTTGVVRMAVEEFFNDLKRAHWIDFQTRAMTITLPLRSNHLAVRSRVTLMLETTSTGTLLPSYDIETRVESEVKQLETELYVQIALAMCAFFVLLELIEMASEGFVSYFTDPWNLMDWINYILFLLTWMYLQRSFELRRSHGVCASAVCHNVGYFDDWELMDTVRTAKLYLSLCVCIQLLKIIKFMKKLIPKMALATAVLYKGAMDLFFFGLVFVITMGAFSMMFYVQLGPNMEGYNDQVSSFVSLARALFGDFDVPEILNNSRGYVNLGLFLTYLFVAIFIMLSMFLAILGESQNAVRMDQDEQRRLLLAPPEYGVFTYGYEAVASAAAALRRKLRRRRARLTDGSAAAVTSKTRTLPAAAEGGEGGGEGGEGGEGECGEGGGVADIEMAVARATDGAPTRHDSAADGASGGAAAARGDGVSHARSPALTSLRGLVGGAGRSPRPPAVDGTPRPSTRAMSVRTEIAELAAEVTAIADRQKRMATSLRHLEPRTIHAQLAQLVGLLGASPNGAPPRHSHGDAPRHHSTERERQSHRSFNSHNGACGGSARYSQKAMAPPPAGGRQMHMPPLLDVCLADGDARAGWSRPPPLVDSENISLQAMHPHPHGGYGGGGGGGGGGGYGGAPPPAQHHAHSTRSHLGSRHPNGRPAPTLHGEVLEGVVFGDPRSIPSGETGWARARRAVQRGRCRGLEALGSLAGGVSPSCPAGEGDTPARPRRERPPSMREEARARREQRRHDALERPPPPAMAMRTRSTAAAEEEGQLAV